MRLLLIALVSLALAGCWTGRNLYADSDATMAIPAGKYRASYNGKTHIEDVSRLSNGLTQMADNEGKALYGFKPVGSEGRRYVAWSADDSDDGTQAYMVLERRSDREFVIYFPNCDGEDGDLARRAGATVEKQTMVTECQFSSRASLERAVRGLKLAGAMRLVRISRR